MGDPAEAAAWERLFWLVFERSSNPMVVLDGRRCIMMMNDAAVSLFGGERGDLVGTSIVDSIRPADRPAAEKDWEAFLRSRAYSGTRALARADGSEVQIDFAARLEYIGGRPLALYVALSSRRERRAPAPAPGGQPLTGREREVVTLIALGSETDQIARRLHISPQTVRTHVRNAMSKLGAHTRAQLVALVLCTDEAVHEAFLEAMDT